jgi:hypothetical protein
MICTHFKNERRENSKESFERGSKWKVHKRPRSRWDVLLREFLPCKAMCDINYRYKYVTYFVRAGTELLNLTTMGTNCPTGDTIEHTEVFFCTVSYSKYVNLIALDSLNNSPPHGSSCHH